jgi:Cu+-exporting ATPase
MSTEKSISLHIHGMTCASCAHGVEKVLTRFGASDISINVPSHVARFTLPTDKQPLISEISKQITALGFTVEEHDNAHGHHHHHSHGGGIDAHLKRDIIIAAIFTVPLIAPMVLPWLHALHNPLFQAICATPVLIIGLKRFGMSALRSLQNGYANMDVLIMLGAIASYGYSIAGLLFNLGENYVFFESSATIITIVLIGNILEELSVRKTTSALTELTKLQPAQARRIVRSISGQTRIELCDVERIAIGDHLYVSAGDKLPVDGVVIEGSASIDESMITGESTPRTRSLDSHVVGGSIVTTGSITFKATAVGAGTVLSRIIALVDEAQARKPSIQKIGDKVSGIFVPVVGVLSICTLIGSLLFGIPLGEALLRAIAILVVACPCAMGLATPAAVAVGVGRAAKNGVLLKGGDILERLAGITQVLFDKTGTLTEGTLTVSQMNSYQNHDRSNALAIAQALAHHSLHPASRAIERYLVAQSPALALPMIDALQEIPGIGIIGAVAGTPVGLGGKTVITHLHAEKGSEVAPGVFLVIGNHVVATFTLQDQLRTGAQAAVTYLKEQNVHLGIISGDINQKVEELARELAIDSWYGEKLPHEKLAIIQKLSQEHSTAFVGDGVNDAPSLAQASVGISMSTGSGAALESAQVVLLHGDLHNLIQAHSIAQKTLRVIKQNLFWAFSYNIIAIPLAMFGYLTPMVAALAMTGSDLVVIANSIRLRKL